MRRMTRTNSRQQKMRTELPHEFETGGDGGGILDRNDLAHQAAAGEFGM
ncbi:hypothetical protein FIU89_10350 [Roseovarius sp. THAF27]|nr:hypothetical protein FIU89_10350 [Roseovarius sp. THAF27]